MIKGLIAEIGNMHLGDVAKACELIYVAKESGADYVKMQAIGPYVFSGSMPREFYEQSSMTVNDYLACVEYGKSIGTKVFFSIFASHLDVIWQRYPRMIKKISAAQYKNAGRSSLRELNNTRTIISLPSIDSIIPNICIDKMNILYATPYNVTNYDLSPIDYLAKIYDKNIGLSDHSIGVDTCIQAIKEHGSKLIEKHFYMGEDIVFKGKLYRDCTHSANPKEFERLAKAMKGK